MKRLRVKTATNICTLLMMTACHRNLTEEANLVSVHAMAGLGSTQESLSSDNELLPLKSFTKEVVHLGDKQPVIAYRYQEPDGRWSLYLSLTEKEPMVGRYYPYGSYVIWLEPPTALASVGFDADWSPLEKLLAEPLRAQADSSGRVLSPAKLVAKGNAKPAWALYEYDHHLGRLFLTQAVEKNGYAIDVHHLTELDGLSIKLLEPLGETLIINIPTFGDLVDQLTGYPVLPSPGESWGVEAYLKPVRGSFINPLKCNLIQQRVINAPMNEQLNLVAGNFVMGDDGLIASYDQQMDHFTVALYSSQPLPQMSSIYHVGLKGVAMELSSHQYEESYKAIFKEHSNKALYFEQLIDADASKLKKGVDYGTFMRFSLIATDGAEHTSPWLLIEAPWDKESAEVTRSPSLMLDHPWLKENLPSLEAIAAYDRLELYYLDKQMKIKKISYNNLFTLVLEAQRLFEFTSSYALYQKNRD